VPLLLTDHQKENCVEISQELLDNANGNENFLKNVITGVETWVHGYDVETNMQSLQWMEVLRARLKNENVKMQTWKNNMMVSTKCYCF
jgi:hypothetical protein